MDAGRSREQRRADAIEQLERSGHALLATADQAGGPHVIAVAIAWTGSHIIVATRDGSVTARNLDASGQAELAFGTPDDLLLIDALVASSEPAKPTSGEVAHIFRAAAGWDPAEQGSDWRYFVLRPSRMQAYRGYSESGGGVIMRDGRWLAGPA